jgi:hypothetical protein
MTPQYTRYAPTVGQFSKMARRAIYRRNRDFGDAIPAMRRAHDEIGLEFVAIAMSVNRCNDFTSQCAKA